SKVKPYTLPELLKMANGEPVKDAEMWFKKRRPEILNLFATEIFGRIPDNAPKVIWEVASIDEKAADGTAIPKKVVGTMSDKDDAPKIHLNPYVPAEAKGPVPVIVIIGAGGGGKFGAGKAPPGKATKAAPTKGLGGIPGQILAKGFAFAGFSHTEVQP